MAPFWIIGLTVVGKPEAAVIISSPLFIFVSPKLSENKELKATRFAEEPELTGIVCFIPTYSLKPSLNSFVYLQ